MTHLSLSSLLVIRLNVAIAERLKSLGLFDVMALPIELQQLYDLRTKPSQFLRVVFEMLDQNDRRGEALTIDQFSALVTDDDVYTQIWEAFTREVTDFFREPLRPAIAEVFQILELAEAERVADLRATIQASLFPPASNFPGDPSGEPPESSASIPDLSHFDSLTIWPLADAAMNGHDIPASAPSPPTVTDPSDNPLSMPTISTPTETRPAS